MSSDLSQDIPDDDLVAGIFSEASRRSEACRPPSWLLSGQVNLPKESSLSLSRVLGVYMCTDSIMEKNTNDLMFLEGKGVILASLILFTVTMWVFKIKLIKQMIKQSIPPLINPPTSNNTLSCLFCRFHTGGDEAVSSRISEHCSGHVSRRSPGSA